MTDQHLDLDEILPDPTYRIATSRVVLAPPAVVWQELVALPLSAIPVGFALIALRHLPAVLSGREPWMSGATTFLDATPIPVVHRDEPHRIVSAGLSRPWRLLGGGAAPELDLGRPRGAAVDGWIEVVMSFDLLQDRDDGTATLSTETRIGVFDRRAARAFGPYWWVIRGSSVRIRREVVAEVARRAEPRARG